MTQEFSKIIADYQEMTFRSGSKNHLQNKEEAVEFINERGFILFHPSNELTFPSLWAARAGNRPVPNEHDDPGHITWQWKDELLGEQRCYYGRLLGQKMTFVSLELLPFFFRFSRNIDFENDYLFVYNNGEMSFEARSVYEVLLDEGPMDTLLLRKKAGMWGKENQYRYTKALNWLQTELMVLPVGIAEVGRWKYGFIFDILPRHYPNLVEETLSLRPPFARLEILRRVIKSLGSTSLRNIQKVLRWSREELLKTVYCLEEEEFLVFQAGKTNIISESQLTLKELLL